MPVPQLHKDLCAVNSVTVKYDVSADATGKVAFTLPKGAIPMLGSQAFVTTAFNGTTPTVKIGLKPQDTGTLDDDALFASADVAPASAGFKPIVAATLAAGVTAPLSADTDVVFTVGGGGGNTAGVVYVTINYVVETAKLPLGY